MSDPPRSDGMRRFRALLPAAGLLLLLSCGDDATGGDPGAVSRIELSPESPLLDAVGRTVSMQARVFREDGSVVTDAAVAWSSSDPRVASIDKAGFVRAIADGATVVGASYLGVSASTTLTVRQTVAGLAFAAGPRDAVVGGSSGDVTVIVHDALGTAVSSADGDVTLGSVAGSPGSLAGGPRTVLMQQGRAEFADVRLTGSGDGYRLEAAWSGRVATSLPFSLVQGLDLVALTHAPGAPAGLLIDGFGSGEYLNDVAVVAGGDTAAVGIFRSMPGGNDEILVFGPGRRPAMLRPAPWTAGIDTLAVALEEPIALDLTVWIVKGPFESQSARARAAIDTTVSIWAEQNAGLAFDSVEVVDATGDPDAARFFELTLCNSQSLLESLIGRRTGRLNVYYVGTVDGGTDRGRACPIGGDHAIMAERSGHELLSHEIGHLLSLTHTDAITALFDPSNVMHSASSRRRYLTEGQTFRQQFDTNSVLNAIFRLRTAQARSCPLSQADALCPAIENRIWADGIFPPNAGAGRATTAPSGIRWPSSPRDLVLRWLVVKCEMEQNEGLGQRLRESGESAVAEFLTAFNRGPSDPAADPQAWRLAALDGLAWLGTPAALDALAHIRDATTGVLRREATLRLDGADSRVAPTRIPSGSPGSNTRGAEGRMEAPRLDIRAPNDHR